MTDEILLRISSDEALVLFEWLHRMEESLQWDGVTQHHAEKVALWNLSALLEREMVQPLQDDYQELVAAARGRLGETT